MKKLIVYLRISALSGCAALAVSCTNYLDLNDPDSLSKGNFPTSIGHIDLLVNSVYGAQHHWCFLGNYWAGYVMYCLDPPSTSNGTTIRDGSIFAPAP